MNKVVQKAVCKYCHRKIVIDNQDNYETWHIPMHEDKIGPWWECRKSTIYGHYHEPEEKETNFDKIYNRLKYEK